MIIHMWMHWFWITTASFKGFIIFTLQMISYSCIPHPSLTEAGLLLGENFTRHNLNLREEINSSQIQSNPNITSLPFGESDDPNRRETSSEADVAGFTPKTEILPRMSSEFATDAEDTRGGGSLDVFQYPAKKFAKYSSRVKYGKVKGKGKGIEESGGDDARVEAVKVVEEKLDINLSVADPETEDSERNRSRKGPGPTKTSEAAPDDGSPEFNVTEPSNATFVSFATEAVLKERVPETEFSTAPENSTEPSSDPTEDQKDVPFKNDTLVIENKVEESSAYTTVESFVAKNRAAAATSAQNFSADNSALNAGSITGITLGILVLFSLFGAVSFVLYRRRYLNKPQVLNDKCSNLDSSGYIDDTSLRENSEEMYSLDNDSFLNSLEAMTIQNYWTENVKHTKL